MARGTLSILNLVCRADIQDKTDLRDKHGLVFTICGQIKKINQQTPTHSNIWIIVKFTEKVISWTYAYFSACHCKHCQRWSRCVVERPIAASPYRQRPLRLHRLGAICRDSLSHRTALSTSVGENKGQITIFFTLPNCRCIIVHLYFIKLATYTFCELISRLCSYKSEKL